MSFTVHLYLWIVSQLLRRVILFQFYCHHKYWSIFSLHNFLKVKRKLINQLTNFHKTWYDHYATRGCINFIL
jgi:hypothetical protein